MSDVDWGAIQALVDQGFVANADGTITTPGGEIWESLGPGQFRSIENGGTPAPPQQQTSGPNWDAINELVRRGWRANPDGSLTNPDGVVGSMQDGQFVPKPKAKSDEDRAREGRNIAAAVRSRLIEFFTEGEADELGKLINQFITEDASEDEIFLKIRDTQVWKNRFKGNEIRKQKGLSVLDPRTYIEVERSTRQLFMEAGMPEGFYDNRDDYHEIIGKDISPREMSRRIQNGFVKVSQADPRIRQAYGEYFGVNGDVALASMFLDFDKAVDVLERQVAAAEFGGTGKRFGFNVNFAKANEAALLGVTKERAEQGMAEVAELEPLFSETISENQDLVAENEGFNSVFGFDSTSAAAIRKRREERVARQSGAGAGSLTTQRGFVGLSTAR